MKEIKIMSDRELMACQAIAQKLPDKKFAGGLTLKQIQEEVSLRLWIRNLKIGDTKNV